jgi:hypothetical protein
MKNFMRQHRQETASASIIDCDAPLVVIAYPIVDGSIGESWVSIAYFPFSPIYIDFSNTFEFHDLGRFAIKAINPKMNATMKSSLFVMLILTWLW